MGIVSVAFRKVRSATTFSAVELVLIAPAFVLLGLARLAVLILPFRTYARLFGTPADGTPPDAVASDRDSMRARRIGRIVRRTAKITPWQSVCLPQAMVAAFFLRLAGVPHRAIFGLARDGKAGADDPLKAHAWVRVGDYNATGGQDVSAYVVVKVFERPARRGD